MLCRSADRSAGSIGIVLHHSQGAQELVLLHAGRQVQMGEWANCSGPFLQINSNDN